jgi:hypothetical protein
MSARTFVGGWLVVVTLLGTAGACGQDVATCASICAFPGAGPECLTDCNTQQSACTAAGYAGNFQDYLTCIGTVGTYGVQQDVQTTNPGELAQYSTVVPLCAAEVAAIASECGTPSPGLAGTGSGTSSSTGSSSDPSPASSTDAGTTTTTQDSGSAAAPCVLGGVCSLPGSSCTNPGVGPCSSDQRLECDSSGHLTSAGFVCNAQVPSCGWGSGSCNETCNCTNGIITCTGDCPDGGLASP